MSNVSTATGFAWNNIHHLFSVLVEAFELRGVPTYVSFRRIEPSFGDLPMGRGPGPFQLNPTARTVEELLALDHALRLHRVRYLYLTDQDPVSWRYPLYRLAGVRRILIHSRVSVADPGPAKKDGALKSNVKYLLSRLPLASADRVYAVSDFVRQRLVVKARFRPDRVVKILNGIDLDRFRPGETREVSSPLQVFCGGRASRHKGIQVLIQAVARLKSTPGVPAFEVRFAGAGPDLDAFRALSQRLGVSDVFHFLGELPQTHDLQRKADIIVVPSTWGDACPSAVSEALACGKPLVATKAGGIPELVGGSDNALLVPPSDAGALAESILALLKDPELRRALGGRARRRAADALDQHRYHDEVVRQMISDCRLDQT